jgi:hypothetical protein
MKTSKSQLLDQLLNERVYITTDLTSAIQMPEGELVEAPLIVEGVILDYDCEFLLVGQLGRDSLELIRRDRVVGVKQISEDQEIFDDPNRPDRGEMN